MTRRFAIIWILLAAILALFVRCLFFDSDEVAAAKRAAGSGARFHDVLARLTTIASENSTCEVFDSQSGAHYLDGYASNQVWITFMQSTMLYSHRVTFLFETNGTLTEVVDDGQVW
jgi:hypothetical protein